MSRACSHLMAPCLRKLVNAWCGAADYTSNLGMDDRRGEYRSVSTHDEDDEDRRR